MEDTALHLQLKSYKRITQVLSYTLLSLPFPPVFVGSILYPFGVQFCTSTTHRASKICKNLQEWKGSQRKSISTS